MSDWYKKMDAMRAADPQIAEMLNQTRRKPWTKAIKEIRGLYPDFPTEEEYDIVGALEDGAISVDRIKEYRSMPRGLKRAVDEAEGGQETEQLPFEFIPEQYYREDGWGPGNMFSRIRNFELTTGQRQIIHPFMRAVGTGTIEGAENVLDTARPALEGTMTNAAEAAIGTINPELGRTFESWVDEAYEQPFGEMSTMTVNAGNGIAGIAEFMGAEVTEFLMPLLLSRKVVPGTNGAKVNFNAPLWQRTLTRVANGIREGVDPRNIVGEVVYAQGDENVPGFATAEGLRALGFDLTDQAAEALGNLSPEEQRFVGNYIEGMVLFEGLRWSGITVKGGGKMAYASTFGENGIVRDYAFRLMQPAMRELNALSRAMPASMVAFHGSPHRFEKFSLDKIGTGEGAQAYGHGLYFAENPGVAKGYKSTLRNSNTWLIDGEPYHGTTTRNDAGPHNYAANALARFDGDKEAAIKWLNDFGMEGEARNIIRNAKKVEPDEGHLYEVDIPDEAINKMLDWDKPLSEQPYVMESLTEYVRRDVAAHNDNLLLTSGETQQIAEFIKHADEVKGWELVSTLHDEGYSRLGQQGSYKNTSDILRSAGIPGTKYLDATSRGAGEGTRNFVVFDEDIITPLKRNDEAIK